MNPEIDTQESSACIINHPDGQVAFDAYLATLPSWHDQQQINEAQWEALFTD